MDNTPTFERMEAIIENALKLAHQGEAKALKMQSDESIEYMTRTLRCSCERFKYGAELRQALTTLKYMLRDMKTDEQAEDKTKKTA